MSETGKNMGQTINKTTKDLVKIAISNVPAISAEDAIKLVKSSDHVFVDVRLSLIHI